VIFIREGYYREGIFKFEISIPQNYPSKPPEIKFTSKVFHPLIDLTTGRLDISVNKSLKLEKILKLGNWEKLYCSNLVFYTKSFL
jgi:ubiquitin-protein ligase